MKKFNLSQDKVFLTSDSHFYHEAIIEYCNRPFKNALEMNEVMIQRWNEVVGPEDTVIHHGDFAFGKCTMKEVAEIVFALNGNIIFVEGNHDHVTVLRAHYKYNLFKEVHRDLDIRVITNEEEVGDYIDIHCAHFPKLIWNKKHYGAWHSFGHVHSTKPIDNQDFNQHDVGVDRNNFTPLTIKQFGSIITTRHLEGWEK